VENIYNIDWRYLKIFTVNLNIFRVNLSVMKAMLVAVENGREDKDLQLKERFLAC
jgi:hypothetical protein